MITCSNADTEAMSPGLRLTQLLSPLSPDTHWSPLTAGLHKTLVGGNKSSWKWVVLTRGTVKDIGSMVVSVNLQLSGLAICFTSEFACNILQDCEFSDPSITVRYYKVLVRMNDHDNYLNALANSISRTFIALLFLRNPNAWLPLLDL